MNVPVPLSPVHSIIEGAEDEVGGEEDAAAALANPPRVHPHRQHKRPDYYKAPDWRK